jgi:hypothetical protein
MKKLLLITLLLPTISFADGYSDAVQQAQINDQDTAMRQQQRMMEQQNEILQQQADQMQQQTQIMQDQQYQQQQQAAINSGY